MSLPDSRDAQFRPPTSHSPGGQTPYLDSASSPNQAGAFEGNLFLLVPRPITSELPWMPAVPRALLIRQERCHTTSLGHCPRMPWAGPSSQSLPPHAELGLISARLLQDPASCVGTGFLRTVAPREALQDLLFSAFLTSPSSLWRVLGSSGDSPFPEAASEGKSDNKAMELDAFVLKFLQCLFLAV